ncbi:MAG: hypothetical protein ACREJ9_05980 [Candidatus Rokuibacteriota bacterium]
MASRCAAGSRTGRDILACGADAIMDKPIAVDEFRSRVMALLSARR